MLTKQKHAVLQTATSHFLVIVGLKIHFKNQFEFKFPSRMYSSSKDVVFERYNDSDITYFKSQNEKIQNFEVDPQ